MKRRSGLQSLDVSACTGIQEEGFRAIASLTQLTALDASCLADNSSSLVTRCQHAFFADR